MTTRGRTVAREIKGAASLAKMSSIFMWFHDQRKSRGRTSQVCMHLITTTPLRERNKGWIWLAKKIGNSHNIHTRHFVLLNSTINGPLVPSIALNHQMLSHWAGYDNGLHVAQDTGRISMGSGLSHPTLHLSVPKCIFDEDFLCQCCSNIPCTLGYPAGAKPVDFNAH